MQIKDAFRLLLTKIAKDKVLPFEPLIPNEQTLAAMREVRQSKLSFARDTSALMDALNADN